MRQSKITGIVSGFLEENAALEIIPCIFHVTLVASTTTNRKATISENQQEVMVAVLSFIAHLNQELNSTGEIHPCEINKEMDYFFQELEASIRKKLQFYVEEESLEVRNRINQFVADYHSLKTFLNEKVSL